MTTCKHNASFMLLLGGAGAEKEIAQKSKKKS
jgi:hypothetical protein